MLWQKRAVAKAGHLSQRCSAGSTSSSQSRQRSDCFSCEVQPSAEALAKNIRPFGHTLAYLFSVLTESDLSFVLNA